jgi:hypothetical protein
MDPQCRVSYCAEKSYFSTQAKIIVLWCGHASKKKRTGLCYQHETGPKPSTFERERLTIMATHVSATALEETSHETETTQITISDALRRRAQSVINDRRIDPQWRTIVRYALEINDPWLADVVRRAGAGEKIIDSVDFTLEPDANEDDSNKERVEALAEIICRAGDESAAALLVLMGTLENSRDPKLLANTVKHFAFTLCGESNLFGMVDAQLAIVESELLAAHVLIS